MIPFLLAAVIEPQPAKPQPQAASTPPEIQLAQAEPAASRVSLPPSSYPYASIKLGAGFPWDYNGDFDVLGENVDTSLKLDSGFTGELALGYRFDKVRAELAVGYGHYNTNKQTFSSSLGNFSTSSNGAVNLTTVMVNGYYDIPITNSDGSPSRWSPYIGAGLGYANLSTPSCSGNGCFSGGSAGGFAYQGNVGVSYRVADQSHAFLETGYLGATGGTVDQVNFDTFGSWRVFLGWRQGFGGASKRQTAAAPLAQPAPDPSVRQAPLQQPQPEPPIRGLW